MDILYLKWECPINGKKYIIGALCRNDNKYYFKLSKQHVEESCKETSSVFSEILFSMFKIRIPKIETYDEDEMNCLLEDLDLNTFDEMKYLEKTKGKLLTDHFILEKEK